MVVLEELDAAKKGISEIACNARQVSRFLDELMQDKNHTQIEKGLSLPGARASSNGTGKTGHPATGKLYFQTRPTEAVLPRLMPGTNPDNRILLNDLNLQKTEERRVGKSVDRT